MALHVRGSGTQKMILYDAEEWNSGVTLLKRDCGLFTMAPTVGNNTGIRVSIPTSVYNLDGFTSNNTCIQNDQTISYVPRSLLLEYGMHASIRLDEQPFLFANDLIFTAVEGQKGQNMLPTWSIKIQRIYSNQANEFTVIPLNQNLPSMGPCTTPSDCSNIAAQCLSAVGCKPAIPYGYDHSANAIPLGTTTQRYALWVTNPSLEPFYAFSSYCKNRYSNNTNSLQISILSSYGGIRIWRMDPYLYCPENPNTQKLECPEQQNVLTKMIQSLDFEDFDIALCDQKFNVMALDFDYVNEDNVALTVLRTSLANVNVYTLTAIDESLAEYVTLWVNPNTLEIRNDTLWMPEAASPALAQGFLCPSQRRMPNAGSMFAEGINSIIFFLRLPINILLAFPIILDLSADRCPLLSRGHGILKTCGRELLSLDDFFTSVFRANALFWQSFNIVADSFGPGAPQTFINGAVAVADSRFTSIPFDPQRFGSMGEVDVAKIQDVMSNSLVGMPRVIQVANIASKNPIANFEFYYNLGSKMLVNILRASQQTKTIANVFWNVVADGAQEYEIIVLQRMKRMCAGFAIMAGFNTPLGKMVHRWCTAHVELQKGFLSMAITFFVDIPLMDCICIKSKGSVLSQYVTEKCWPDAPDLMKPMLNTLITLEASEICPTMVTMTQLRFKEALDEFFALLEAGTRELSSVMDSFVQGNFKGDCNNFVDNPYVLTLIPQPVDYFRVCGKTDVCRYRCLSEMQAFEARNIEMPSQETITENVKSLFFNSMDDDTYMPLKPLAMIELHNCTYPCGYVETIGTYSDRCILLGGENGNGMLEIISFCVPVQLGANVRRGKQSFVVENLVAGALQTGFVFYIDPIDFWKSFRLLVLTQTSLHVCHESCLKMTDVDQVGVVRFVQFVILGNNIILEVLKLTGQDTVTTTKATYCFYFFGTGVSQVESCVSNVFTFETHKICEQTLFNDCPRVMTIPKSSGGSVQACYREQYRLVSCTTYKTSVDFTYRSSLPSIGTFGQSAVIQGDPFVWHVFTTTPHTQKSHWLQMLKLVIDATGTVSGTMENGMPAQLNVNVRRKCSLENCVGCRDLGLQRMCYAASECQIARCIGTLVHQRRPLCSIGMHLAATVQNELSFIQGAWMIVSETMVSVLSLSGGVNPPTEITWPDKAFFAYICSAKDMSSTAISIVTASVNGIVQSIGEMPMVQANQPVITNNAYILFSMTMAATTNFLNQIAMAPLYAMMSTQKIFICNANSILAVVGQDKMTVTLGDRDIQDASAKATGKCISQYFEEGAIGAGTGTDNDKSMISAAVDRIVETYAAVKLESLIHPMDAALTWLQGVITGLQDVIQTIDRNRCKLPDMSSKDSFKCACNDNGYRITPVRMRDTWENQGFWCSTVMSLLNFDGTTKYVWNPYSLEELESFLSATTARGTSLLHEYLNCVATGGQCTPPSNVVFDRQQVSMIAVYQRCLANYQMKQWDAGTFAIWDDTIKRQIQATIPEVDCIPLRNGPYSCLSDCLTSSQANGASNAGCYLTWAVDRNFLTIDFFEYEPTSSVFVHSCQVFSGPAKLEDSLSVKFKQCLDEYTDDGVCKLPNIVWSGRSVNKVPIANDHSTIITDESAKLVAAQNSYRAIQNDVNEALQAMANWTAENLNIMIFSAEGDMLHQFFDCYMMGAFEKTELWPSPESAPQPFWSRSTSFDETSRNFELPCSGEALRDRLGTRDSKSPFTCGSFSRRAAIKYFLRNVVTSDPRSNQNIVQTAVSALVEKLKVAWLGDLSTYMCRCPSGQVGPDCCVLDPSCDPSITRCPCADGSQPSYACCDVQCKESTFLPSRFQIEFDKIKGQNLVETLFDQVSNYLNTTVWQDNKAWLLYDMGAEEYYNWTHQQSSAYLEHGAFDTTSPIIKYDISEYGYPYKTSTVDMCHGLLQQIMFTLPMTEEFMPTTVRDAYDPDAEITTLNITYREEFVQRLIADAYKSSPLYWHYLARHKPSDSNVCRRNYPQKYTTLNQDTFPTMGFESLTLGGHYADCYCGWWFNSSHCIIPSNVCDRLVLLVGLSQIQTVCVENNGISEPHPIHDWMATLIENEGWVDWKCPSMNVSDLWGIMPNHLLWMRKSSDVSQINNFILTNGTSGLRVGSLEWFKEESIKFINPAERREKIHPLECEMTPSQNLLDSFVDDLFPVAQGARVSAVSSYCLRFSIEVARLTVYQEAGLVLAIAEQTGVVAQWRQKCDLKLRQASFCKTFGIYDVIKTTEFCPFQVSAAFENYVLTENCLVIYLGKVYDPCLCNSKWCSETMDLLNILELTTECEIAHVQNFVIDKTNKLPIYPVKSDNILPRPLRKSSFKQDVLLSHTNVANNAGDWATAEGTNFLYCDLVVDWWPDHWKHPVGYHVTVPCEDAAFRTFDAAWSALRIGNIVKMMYTQNALRNNTMQFNMFGAASVCRTHNYGMPTKVLNTIRYCTQSDDRAVDPTVHDSKDSSANWGLEYCSTSPFDVPWDQGPTSVGTYFNYLVDIKSFQAWGDAAGHAPFKGCTSDNDCGNGYTCLMSRSSGVCAELLPGQFECAQHQHCLDRMCSGTGLCVDPILEIKNNRSDDIVAKVFSDQCATDPTDTWGTSKEELVGDILHSSGMCSYRSWFEQRNLKSCSATECSLNSTDAWMFSSPLMTPRSAFDASILKIQSHPCDRSYEHFEGLYSCNPRDTLLRDENGNTLAFQRGKLTQTYRVNKDLPIVKHDWSNVGVGFLGIPKTYSELGYGNMASPTSSPKLRPCANFGLCSTQASAGYWFVNGNNEPVRYVTMGSLGSFVVRPANIDDTTLCGSMGFQDTTLSSQDCRIDPAVVPLFYVYCTRIPVPALCSKYQNGIYTKGKSSANLQALATELNALLTSLSVTSINTFTDYLDAVEIAKNIWTYISTKKWTTQFPLARVDQTYQGRQPMGLYYLMSYSAYEFPFAWWWRCTWLSNIPISGSMTQCDAWDAYRSKSSNPSGLYAFDSVSDNANSVQLKFWLASVNGTFNHEQIQLSRNKIHAELLEKIKTLDVPEVNFVCYNTAYYNRSMNDPVYDYEMLKIADLGNVWPESQQFGKCRGIKSCLVHQDLSLDGTKLLVSEVIQALQRVVQCNPSCKCLTESVVEACAFAQNNNVFTEPLTSVRTDSNRLYIDLFVTQYGSGEISSSSYVERVDGCTTVHCCPGNLNCNGARQVPTNQCECLKATASEQEIVNAGLTPQPTLQPWIIFTKTNTNPSISSAAFSVTTPDYFAINICKPSGKTSRCTFGDPVPQDNCSTRNDNLKQFAVDIYCKDNTRQFENFDAVSEVCMGDMQFPNSKAHSQCFGDAKQTIANRFLKKPTYLNLGITFYTIPDKTCYKLTCDLNGKYARFNNEIVYSNRGFSDSIRIQVKVKQIDLKYGYSHQYFIRGIEATGLCADPLVMGCFKLEHREDDYRKLHVEVYLQDNETPSTKILSFKTRTCTKTLSAASFAQGLIYCYQNVKLSRSTSQEYRKIETPLTRHDASKFTHLTNEQIHEMAIKLVEDAEDYLNEVQVVPVCQTAEISTKNIQRCQNFAVNASIVRSTTSIAAEEKRALWESYTSFLCERSKYSGWYTNNYCKYDICADTCCEKVVNSGPRRYCTSELATESTKYQTQFGFNVVDIEYAGVITDTCTKTEMICPYNEAQQTKLKDYGLPNIGFCPSCIISNSQSCETSKRTTTYNMVRSVYESNDFLPTQLLSSTSLTPTNTTHFYMEMLPYSQRVGAPQCNIQSCSRNQYRVEMYQNLFVCIDCKLIAPKHCSGAHMCSFNAWQWPEAPLRASYASVFEQNGNDFGSTYPAVRNNILAMLPRSVQLQPEPNSMLQDFDFEVYNPDIVKSAYNDNMENLKGYCDSNDNLPIFTNCQNDGPRQTLKSFVFNRYKISDGKMIPSKATLSWIVDKTQLLHTNVVSWFVANRLSYFEDLFNDEMCKRGNIATLICYRDTSVTPAQTLTTNPVLSGDFEVQEGCDAVEQDSTRVIDSLCNDRACPNIMNSDRYDKFNTFQGTSYDDLANQSTCKTKSNTVARYLSTPKSYPTNMCAKKPTLVTTCSPKQGIIGHATYDGESISTPYARQPIPTERILPSGLLSRSNKLLNFERLSGNMIGNLTLSEFDIAGHYIRMKLQDGLLSVEGLPLSHYASMQAATSLHHVRWVDHWKSNRNTESDVLMSLYAMKTCQSFDCPLRRRYFWTAQHPSFRPMTPSPFRVNALYESLTHPTTKPTRWTNSYAVKYQSRNGFCVCSSSEVCSPPSGSCSSQETINSLSDFQYRPASVLDSSCFHQMDWPYVGGDLRDDTKLSERAQRCNVIGRLPTFLYRYHNSRDIISSTTTTLDEGGDCHMGRPASYDPEIQNCKLVEKRETEIIVRCLNRNVTIARPKSASIKLSRRKVCSQCDPLPTYHAADGTILNRSEVSYGQLWRWAPVRKLAQDLKSKVCSTDSCPQLSKDKFLLNSFWPNMMAGGLAGEPVKSFNSFLADEDPVEDDWTSTPWMLCTNNGTGNDCHGAASKSQWLADRHGTCASMRNLPNAQSAVADMTVCDLDETLDNLCRVIQNARYRLFETNCKLSGKCRTSSFFYQPATFSISNDQLSRQTVQYFYDFIVNGSCPAMTQETLAIIQQNRRTAQECSSQALEMFQLAISHTRESLRFFVKIFYYMMEIGLNIISLLTSTDPNPIITRLFGYFNAIVAEFRQFFVTLGDTFFKMIMETGQLGKFIRDLVIQICQIVSFLIDDIVQPLICFFKTFVVEVIKFFKNVGTVLSFGLGDLSYMDGWVQTVENNFQCDFENPLNCSNIFSESETAPSRLPSPTRCWVGYQPVVGDQRGLGCSASDTCMDDDGGLIACASCSGGVNMNRYGCDSLTKLCRCHTFPRSHTQCSAHHECYLTGTECNFVDAYLQPSFGSIACASCSNQPICLITQGVGQCACLFRSTTHQTCSQQYHAQRISPDPTQLCLTSLGVSASASSSYSANFRDLASVPCANLNGAQTWCLNVWMQQGANMYLAVGLALLGRRRLLAATAHPIDVPDWSLAFDPCRIIMMARNHTVYEKYLASECYRWYLIGERAIAIYNISNVTGVQFTSYRGLAEMSAPIAAYVYLLQHVEWVQPLKPLWNQLKNRLIIPTGKILNTVFVYFNHSTPITSHIHVVADLLPWFAFKSQNISVFNDSHLTPTTASNHSSRRLLSWKENLNAVKEMSASIADGNFANLDPVLAENWNKGPFYWPPRYEYTQREHVCLAGSLAFNLSLEVFRSTFQHYTKTGPKRPVLQYTLDEALPKLPAWIKRPKPNEPFLITQFKSALVNLLSVDLDYIQGYASSPDRGLTPSQLSKDVTNLFSCDFEKVQHCHGQRRSLFWGGFLVGLCFLFVSLLGKFLNIPMVDALLFLSYFPVVMYFVFDFSVLCYPMLPTCFMDEMLKMLKVIMPISFYWPSVLLHWDGCLSGSNVPINTTIQSKTVECFRDCSEFPFHYQTWEDNVAWLQCELGWCSSEWVDTQYRPFLNSVPIPPEIKSYFDLARYSHAINFKRVYLSMENYRTAQRACCVLTIFNVVPALMAAVAAVMLLFAAALAATNTVKETISFLIHLVIFVHTN